MNGRMKVYCVLLSAVIAGCGSDTNNYSETQVINGQTINDSEFPAVVKYISYNSSTSTGVMPCTGTFISQNLMLTAAHCFDWGADTAIYKGKRGRVFLNSGYDFNAATKAMGPYDFAIVKFPSNVAPGVMQVGTTPPRNGDRVTLVGYGHNDLDENLQPSSRSSPEIKRKGYNTLNFNTTFHGMIRFRGNQNHKDGSGDKASLGGGDSGGPAIINGKIYCMASFGSKYSRPGEMVSSYSYVLSDQGKAFFAAARRAGYYN